MAFERDDYFDFLAPYHCVTKASCLRQFTTSESKSDYNPRLVRNNPSEFAPKALALARRKALPLPLLKGFLQRW